jgi:hypothetical protein
VDEGAVLVGAVDHLTHRLQCADLVVGKSDGDECGAGIDGVGVGASVAIHRGDLDAMALSLQPADGALNSLVLLPDLGRRRAAPNKARFTASVPEAVNVISVRPALSASAVRSRARSRDALAARPSL